uniref:Uncharacterized protein n=1 Tax=Cucumis sativus TaxID=3659 RepID=A0A0A0L7T2_CUCSA
MDVVYALNKQGRTLYDFGDLRFSYKKNGRRKAQASDYTDIKICSGPEDYVAEYYQQQININEKAAVDFDLATTANIDEGPPFTNSGIKEDFTLTVCLAYYFWGNTLDSHKLIYLEGQQDLGKQQVLVEELCVEYFTQGKYIGDR